MARINLLPWRDELRKEKQKNFVAMLVIAVGITGLAMAGVHYYYVDRIEFQKQRNEYLSKEIRKLDEQIKEIQALESTKAKLQAHLDIIQRLQSSRSEIVHLFDELVRTLPDGVYLKSVTQRGNQVSVSGVAQSNARVSSYMWNIDKSEWLANPRLGVINSGVARGLRVSQFSLDMAQTRKQTEAGEKQK